MTSIESYCGLSCSECRYREKNNCAGCVASEGKPYHGSCEVADCAKERSRRFCGECPDFPCEKLSRYAFDPEYGDNGERIENCKRIKAELVREAREGVDPLGVCGFLCEGCYYDKWCGGCRSKYNVCSYATICEGGVCENVACAAERELYGCFECKELKECVKGYYSKQDEHFAKASALFIAKYGRDKYAPTLAAAATCGISGAQSYDEAGSDEAALALLEKYLAE